MIFKRAVAKLRAQDWMAIVIEFAIVVAGVFVGTLVANANQARVERAQVGRLLVQVQPDLLLLSDYYPVAENYYGTVRGYAMTALAGWRSEPQVSDREFVIAAYQASQVKYLYQNVSLWASIVGTDLIPSIADSNLRDEMKAFMINDFSQYAIPGVTDYRKTVRRIIPIEVQDRIRTACGDRLLPNGKHSYLPATCDVAIDPALVSRTAAALRAHPELAGDLNFHLAQLVTFLAFAKGNAEFAKRIVDHIDRYVGKAETT